MTGPCTHRPGVVFAPVFGLPGPRSSVCQDCGAGITKAGPAGTWSTATEAQAARWAEDARPV